MPGSRVFRHDAFCDGAVNGRYGYFISSFSYGFVTCLNGFHNILDGRTDVRTLAGVVATVAFRLTCPFTS